MRTLLNPWFIGGCLLWLLVLYTRRTGHPLPPALNGYADDAFAVPVIASLVLCFMRVLVIRSNYYILSAWKVSFIVIYLTLVFELLLPRFSKVYTADWLDALLYVIGGIFFYFVMNKPLVEQRTARNRNPEKNYSHG